jgi:hypothetical protein
MLERESRKKRDTDTRLSWGLYILLGIVTLGIYTIYVHWKLIERQQAHYKRMGRFADALLNLVEEQADVSNRRGEVGLGLTHLHSLNEDLQQLQRGKERSAALWTVLGILTLGIAFFYVLYFLNADLVAHDRAESQLVEEASSLLGKLGIGRYPVTVDARVPDHNFALFLLLTIITLGIFGLYWSYVRIKDPNDHFEEHERWEEQLLTTIRTAA